MTTEPKSFEELRFNVFHRIWRWIQSRHIAIRLLLALGLAATVIAAARVGSFGRAPQLAAKVLWPWYIHEIDAPAVRPSLVMTFDVMSRGIVEPGRNGAAYSSGDTVTLHVHPGTSSWVLVFGVDRAGAHPVLGPKLEPAYLQGGKTHDVSFVLDTTTGPETYFCIAASDPFSFAGDISPAFHDGTIKGPLDADLPIDRNRFAQQRIFFTHSAP